MDIFSNRLKIAIKNKGMSIKEISRQTGIDWRTIYIYLDPGKYRRKNVNPHAVNLEALAEVLGVSMDWLWGRSFDCAGCKHLNTAACNRCQRKAIDYYSAREDEL